MASTRIPEWLGKKKSGWAVSTVSLGAYTEQKMGLWFTSFSGYVAREFGEESR